MTKHLADNSHMIAQEAEVFVFPVSFAQQRLWFLEQLVPGNPFYNVPTAVRLVGPLKVQPEEAPAAALSKLNITALEQTFNEIVRRHEALRTTFRVIDGEPVQAIAPSLYLPLSLINLQELPASEREAEVQRLTTEVFQQPFDLAQGPLLRVQLLQLNEAEHVLILTMHHIIADGWSVGVLVRELGTLYAAFASGQPSPLEDLSIQYADFTCWQREWLQGEVLATQLSYWRQQLDAAAPSLDLPTDRPRPAIPTFRGAHQSLMLPKELSSAIALLSAREGVTLFMTLLAAFQTLLYRYTSQEDILVGSPIANRNRSEIEGLIGFFVNSLVLRTNLSGNPTFRELLLRVREVALGAYAHQDLPFEKLVEELQPERDLNRNPLFQVVFALQNAPIEILELPGLTVMPLNFEPGTARFDLELQLVECLGSLGVVVVYSTDLFDAATITRMLENFQVLLASIVANPEERIASLSLLSETEKHQLLVEWNDQADYPQHLCFHQLFEAQVKQTPLAIAAVFVDATAARIDQQLTYYELNTRSNQLAHYLQQLGVGPEVLVGICIERSLEMLVAVLGVFKAGGAYVPLDPTYPQERLSFMLSDAQVSVLLTQDSLNLSLPQGLQVVYLDQDWEACQQNDQNPTINVAPDNLAYIIYTSGSTGKPKGVMVRHQGLCNLAAAQVQVFNLQPDNCILQFASLSFDASIFEIVMALQIGATLYLAREESLKSLPALLKLIQDKQITNITLPPAVLSVLPAAELSTLQTVISAGEACSANIVRQWATGSRRFFNAYGPTEATIWSTIYEFNDSSEQPVLGRPIANTQVYILNSQLQIVPIGAKGELYIGGDGLARSYRNDPELTASHFIPHPFGHQPGACLYKTGDIARYLPNGNIQFLGRQDSQVKLRGFRIELEEISAALAQHPAVRETVVVVREDIPGKQLLVAYVVLNQLAFITSELSCFLRQKLPEYMIPSAFVALEALPLTSNGKVNRRALPIPNQSKPNIERTYVAPRTPTEEKLASIWAELLNLEQVGIYDNFFELGGDSLLTMRLTDQIYKQLDQEIPLSALFLAPTVERLAHHLQPEAASLPWTPLVTIQPTGSQPPFFCVHPIFGVVFPYYELARHLGSDQPFYALQPLGIDGTQLPHTRIEDMASFYIKALRLVQPEGPYFLGGWSFGGLVAFEMAQQLQRAHQVALLALLDTPAPIAANKPSFGDSCKFLLNTAAVSVWPYVLDYLYIARNKHRGHLRPMLRVFQASSQAAFSYKPQAYSNQITLLRTGEQFTKAHRDLTMGWSELAKGIEVYRVPGNHLTILRKPHIQVLAEQLKLCISKAQGEQ